MPARGRAKARDDSQLEFFKLTFAGYESSLPSPPAKNSSEPREREAPSPEHESPANKDDKIALPAVTAVPDPVFEPSNADTVEIRNLRNYRITDEDKLGAGSLKSKCRNNLAAIELLKQVESENRAATDVEKGKLVRYVGWGGIPQIFDAANYEWQQERDELEHLLDAMELESARATTLNAHYTSPTVVRAMYGALSRLGFEHGRILEPACGIGHFIGLMPGEMHARSSITAVEIDSVSARLAKALYPDVDVRCQPFEETKLGDGCYDVAISNVPFGNYKPYDPHFKQWNFLIHDYFFAAALDKIRPGGLLLFISSIGTLDKVEAGLRVYVSQQADLLGAVRLPNDAFKKNANTEVTTDMVVLRKRLPGELQRGPAWMERSQIENSVGDLLWINEYFAARPEMMLGEMRLSGRMYQKGEPALVPNSSDLETQLAEAVGRLPKDIYRAVERPFAAQRSNLSIPAPQDIKPNAYALINGDVAIRDGDSMRILSDLRATTVQRIRGMVRLRDAVRRCLRSQIEAQDESDVTLAREQLNQSYDSFTAKFGSVCESANAAAFRSDPDLPLLLSLERFDAESRRAVKAAIFHERTIRRDAPKLEIDSPKDALLVTLNATGFVNLEHLSALLHKLPSEFLPELKGAVFFNPQSQKWETEDEYLSGNVREKLSVAEAAELVDKKLSPNVEALKAVQPTDLFPSEIDARLGSTWIPAQDVQRFAEMLLAENGIRVAHVSTLGLWQVRGGWAAKSSIANTAEWGTDRRSGLDLLEDALNLRVPTVYDYDPSSERDVVNIPATEAARDKQEKIKERFRNWIWQNEERSERLASTYNREFNNIRLRTFNGDHLTLPGASPAIHLNPHQKAGVWRILQTPNCLLAHVVGAGKTFTMVAAAMELKRLGLAQKPLFVVPNHMLGQFASELLALYPAANILVATKEDFEKSRRQVLMSRIATGTWDAVIVTHSGFEKIPLTQETQKEFFNEQLRELSLAIEERREDSRIVKTLERAKKRLETRLKELTETFRKDSGLNFEELGVDRLFVDEAHYFKNLFYVSKMTRVAGLPQTASQRAMDMFLKVSHVQRLNRGGGVVFATGTPIANSVAEMFTMQRYLQMAALRALKIDHFDSWAATFGEPVTAMELAPDGSGYRLHTRFARFINVPELMMQFRQVADIQTQSMLKLPIPEMRGGKPTTVSAPCSPELKEIVASLVERSEALRTGAVDPRDDNMLVVTTDGRKAALDLRLYDPSLPDHPNSKTNIAVSQIERIWRDTAATRSAQLVFCDLSTPTNGKGFSVYEDMRDKLLARGIPEAEIAFIQDYETDAAKLALFRDVRAGKVRILFGSTQKMGAGTNVQEKLIAIHHLDAPWRPADVEQREGRILRQGNTNSEVQICRYVTESSFDAYMWQTLETKAKFISQVMTGESNLRRIEDIDGTALTYAEVKAIASGNPMVIEKANIEAELGRLGRLQLQYHETQFKLRQRLRHYTEDIPKLEKLIAACKEDLRIREDTHGEKFIIEIEHEIIRDRGIAGELINREAARSKPGAGDREIGKFAGFKVSVANSFLNRPTVMLRGAAVHEATVFETAHGTARSMEHALQSLEEQIEKRETDLSDIRKRIADLSTQCDLPFEYAERLRELGQRQQEISDSLDLTKNQASSGLASDLAESDAPKEESGAVLREMGFPEYEY